MPVTSEQLVAAQKAKRLLADDVFNDTLNELTQIHTERAILLDDAKEREDSRQRVLAIADIRNTLAASVAYAEGEQARDALANEMEDRV